MECLKVALLTSHTCPVKKILDFGGSNFLIFIFPPALAGIPCQNHFRALRKKQYSEERTIKLIRDECY